MDDGIDRVQRRDVNLFGIALPLSGGPRDGEELFGVRPRPSAQLAREAWQPALVLHVQKKLRRAVCMCGDDHLLGGVRMAVQVRGPLRLVEGFSPSDLDRDLLAVPINKASGSRGSLEHFAAFEICLDVRLQPPHRPHLFARGER